MPKKHGFKEQTKVESPKKAPKPYNNYDRKGNYDIGDEFKDSDLNERIERFKKQTKVESPEKAPKTYNNYVDDIGDELKSSDLNERIERFITRQQLTSNSHQDQGGCTSTRKGFVSRTSIFQSTHPTKLSLVPWLLTNGSCFIACMLH